MTGCKVSDLSYSHGIDPQKTLCRFDVGGVCNDSGCAYQHWRDMTVSSVQLARQLIAYTSYGEDQFADILRQATQPQQPQRAALLGDDLGCSRKADSGSNSRAGCNGRRRRRESRQW
jgi:hypothetical protein